MDADSKKSLFAHVNCVSMFTSETHIARYLKALDKREDEPIIKRSRRSTSESFCWKEHCLFCGQSCVLHKDPKHPDRWRPAYLCKTSDRKTRPIYKDAVVEICNQRNDEWGEKVRVRLSDTRANHDLHAADARYHDDCRKNFSNYRNIAHAKKETRKVVDEAYDMVVENIKADTSKMWTSVELHEV